MTEEKVNHISSQLLMLLTSAKGADNANKAVGKLNMMPKAERKLLLYGWNQIVDIKVPDYHLHNSFEVQVECNGQKIAVNEN